MSDEDITTMNFEFKFALAERKERIDRLLKRYKADYKGKHGMMDPKKGVTY